MAVVSSLFATVNPIRSTFDYFKGAVISVLPAFVVGQLVLPLLPGFAWILVIVSLMLVPCALMMANPRYASTATSFAINFLLFVNPREAMTASPWAFVNDAAAVLGASSSRRGVRPGAAASQQGRTGRRCRADLTRLCLHGRL